MPMEPICIRRTGTIEEADIIVAWLDERGVKSTVLDRSNPGVLAFGLTDLEGIAICVTDQATADRAMALLAEHEQERSCAAVENAKPGMFEVRCEECGQDVAVASETRASTQECPHCGAYLDAPGEGVSESS